MIVPAYTYTATASAAIHCGAKVIFVDSQKDSTEMDYDKVAEAITKSTSQVNWSSSDTSVARVSGGDVWATGFGTATITAEANGHTATYDVTVDSYIIEYNPMGGRFADGSANNKKDRIVLP